METTLWDAVWAVQLFYNTGFMLTCSNNKEIVKRRGVERLYVDHSFCFCFLW